MNFVNYATVFNRLARFNARDSVAADVRFALIVSSLAGLIEKEGGSMSAREIAGVVWGIGKIAKGVESRGEEKEADRMHDDRMLALKAEVEEA